MRKDGPPSNTTEENLAGVKANLAEARRNYDKTERVYRTAEIGSDELNEARLNLSRYKSDVEHWSEYVGYYTKIYEAECRARSEAARKRGERIPGEDDGDEGPAPAESDW